MATDTQQAVLAALQEALPHLELRLQPTKDGIPTLWIEREGCRELLNALKSQVAPPYQMLFDLTAIDERLRTHRDKLPLADYVVVYHLLALPNDAQFRVKVPLQQVDLTLPTVTDLWPNANWYEREVRDMFGITFQGHPALLPLIMPPWWQGHPLRKDYPARATEFELYQMTKERYEQEQQALVFDPAAWGMAQQEEDVDYMFLNLGPNHPSTHGVFRIVLQLAGEEIIDAVPDIGYHHRGAEKMAERQTWHGYIPYTDRVDYLGGCLNELPYVMAVERLAGIEVPERVKLIRIMISELFRINSHLLFYGTFAQDVGALSPNFYMFTDREQVYSVITAICGYRMHPNWFRIGGLAQDLPEGWQQRLQALIDYLPRRLAEYDRMVLDNRILKRRTVDIGTLTRDQALAWGVTGPNLRATGLPFDLRKARPYSGYDQLEFEVATAEAGDCYARCLVRVEEMRQSLRILQQCLERMPQGPYKANHPLTTPPLKERTMEDIETLITHFLGVSYGPVIPPGEACYAVEGTKGINAYYLISDGANMAYRTRIRTPSFPHLQLLPQLARSRLVPDLVAILGSIDYVMADVDR